MRRIRLYAIPLVSALAVFLLLCAPAHAASAPAKIFFAYGTLSARLVPLWIAEEQGFFKKYGDPAELVFVRGASTLMAALASGDVPIGVTGGTPALGGAAAGADVAIVANVANRVNVEVMARPGTKSVNDLRGKRFGLQSFGGTTWLYTMLALDQLGLEPVRDNIRLLVVGDQNVLNRALETGTIDALVLSTSVFSRALKEKGFPTLSELKLAIAGTTIVVRKTLIQQQPSVVENLLKAQIEGLAFTLSPGNRATVLNTIKRRLKVSSLDLIEQDFKEFVQEFERKPYPSLDGLHNIQRLMKGQNSKLAQLKVEDVIDDRFVRRLDESGFIDKLYASYGVK